MAETIAKIAWKNKGVARLIMLTGAEINISTTQFDYLSNFYSGQWVVINSETIDPHAEINHIIHSIKALKVETRVDFLLANFENAPLYLARDAFPNVTPLAAAETIQKMIHSEQSSKKSKSLTLMEVMENGKFGRFRSLIDECLRLKRIQTRWSIEELDPLFDENDEKLAMKWMPQVTENESASKAKMLSARIAENVARKFYCQFFTKVTDISLMQLTHESDEWIKFDIKLDDTICIDVKNARNPLNNKNRYVDYCVPKFKKDRTEDVIIAGIFSPYLRLEQMLTQEINYYDAKHILYLGETVNSDIKWLEEQFNSEDLRIDICTHHSLDGKAIIPPWVFSYPQQCYENPNNAKFDLQKLDPSYFPPEHIWIGWYNPVPALVASRLPVPKEWKSIDNYQRSLIDHLNCHGERGFTLPIIYLTILKEFLEQVKTGKDQINYDPGKYRQVLFPLDYHNSPLGVFDPLGVVSDLIECLQLLWKNRTSITWSEIKRFKFQGMGILTAEFLDGKVKTLLAYCGGEVQNVKCGNSPLVYGKHDTCKTCNRLICDKCKCCAENCKDYLKRKRNFGLY